MRTIELIEFIPVIRRLRLIEVGVWADVTLEFGSPLNVITEDGSALGTSSILRALVQAVGSGVPTRDGFVWTHGFLGGRVEVEFWAPPIDPSAAIAIRQPADDPGIGRFMISLLRACLDATPPNMAIIVDDEVTACLDMPAYEEVVGLLNHGRVQIICTIAHRFRSEDFPNARVFSIAVDRSDNATIRLRQPEHLPAHSGVESLHDRRRVHLLSNQIARRRTQSGTGSGSNRENRHVGQTGAQCVRPN